MKLLPYLLIFLVSINIVSAFGLSTITNQALSLDPGLAKIASSIPKLLNPEGQILGLIQSSFINEIQNSAPELLKVTNSYNQIQGYIAKGAKILSKDGMKVNDKGVIVEGSMEFSENQQNIGNLISEKFKPEDISLKNMKFEKKDGLTTFTFKEGGSLKLTKQVKDNTGKLQKVPVIYNNLEKDSAITIDENGEIVKAKINSKNPGSFNFNNIPQITSDYPLTINYENGIAKVYGEKFSVADTQFSNNLQGRASVDIIPNKGFLINENTKALTNGVEIETKYASKPIYLATEKFGNYDKIKTEDRYLYLGKELELVSKTGTDFDLNLYGKDTKNKFIGEGNKYLKIDSGKSVTYEISSAEKLKLSDNNLILNDVDMLERNGDSAIKYSKKGDIDIISFGDINSQTHSVEYGNKLLNVKLCKTSEPEEKCFFYKNNPVEFKTEDKYQSIIVSPTQVCTKVDTHKTLFGKPGLSTLDTFSDKIKEKGRNPICMFNGGIWDASSEKPKGDIYVNGQKEEGVPRSGIFLLAILNGLPKLIEEKNLNTINPDYAISANTICRDYCKKYNKGYDNQQASRNAVGINCIGGKTVFIQTTPGNTELYQIDKEFKKYNCENVVNLDGGGSTSLLCNIDNKEIFIPQEHLESCPENKPCARPIHNVVSVEEC